MKKKDLEDFPFFEEKEEKFLSDLILLVLAEHASRTNRVFIEKLEVKQMTSFVVFIFEEIEKILGVPTSDIVCYAEAKKKLKGKKWSMN